MKTEPNTMENLTKEQESELKQDIEAFTLVKALDLLDDCHHYLKANPPSKETMNYNKWENLVEETDYMREYNAEAAHERVDSASGSVAAPKEDEFIKDGDPNTNGVYLVKVMMCDVPYEVSERIDEFKDGYWINYAQFVLSWKPIPGHILQELSSLRDQLRQRDELIKELNHELGEILNEYDNNELLIKVDRFEHLDSLIKKSQKL